MENPGHNQVNPPLVLALDVDGTIFTHDYPHIGRDIGAVPYLRALSEAGVQIVLHTMRDDNWRQFGGGDSKIETINTKHDAYKWFEDRGIKWTPQSDESWTDSTKPHADLFLDDRGFGTPVKLDPAISPRPFVDWKIVGPMLLAWANIKTVTLSRDFEIDSPHAFKEVPNTGEKSA